MDQRINMERNSSNKSAILIHSRFLLWLMQSSVWNSSTRLVTPWDAGADATLTVTAAFEKKTLKKRVQKTWRYGTVQTVSEKKKTSPIVYAVQINRNFLHIKKDTATYCSILITHFALFLIACLKVFMEQSVCTWRTLPVGAMDIIGACKPPWNLEYCSDQWTDLAEYQFAYNAYLSAIFL